MCTLTSKHSSTTQGTHFSNGTFSCKAAMCAPSDSCNFDSYGWVVQFYGCQNCTESKRPSLGLYWRCIRFPHPAVSMERDGRRKRETTAAENAAALAPTDGRQERATEFNSSTSSVLTRGTAIFGRVAVTFSLGTRAENCYCF